MVLVNLGQLSTDELRNLSEQEKIEGFEDMSREELIQELTDKYEEEYAAFGLDDDKKSDLNVKYVSSFTDYKDNSENVVQLPGVEDLPDHYEETSIHLLSKNSDWGFAFWSISTLDQEKIDEKKGVPLLVVAMTSKRGNKECYDIPISPEDSEWNIGFSYDSASIIVSLCVDYSDGSRDTLAQSKPLEMSSSYWLDHPSQMKENDSLFKVYTSLITTKTGDIINNSIVRDIIAGYTEGGEA